MKMQISFILLLLLLFHKAENMGRSEKILFALASKWVGRARKTFHQIGVASQRFLCVRQNFD